MFRITSRYVRRRSDPFAPVLLVSPLSWAAVFLARFLAWQHVPPLSSTVSTRRLVPTKLLCWHRPTCHDSTNFSNTASSNKGLGYTQNFGKKSEKRRDEWGATSARQTTAFSLSVSLHLSLSLSLSLTLLRFHSLTNATLPIASSVCRGCIASSMRECTTADSNEFQML